MLFIPSPWIPKKKIKIAWDCGNGAAGILIKKLTKRIFADHILLFEEVDGDFPNHHPDPTVAENLEDLKKAVIENGCDLGIAFDGDADRVIIIDENNKPVRGDQLLAIFALYANRSEIATVSLALTIASPNIAINSSFIFYIINQYRMALNSLVDGYATVPLNSSYYFCN